jgi:hypothetical protein
MKGETKLIAPGMGLVIQGEIGGFQLCLEQHVDAATTDIDERLDRMVSAFWRQRAKIALVDALVDVEARRKRLADLPDSEADYVAQRAAARALLRASFIQKHETSGKRGEFRLTPSQDEALRTHDVETAQKRAEMAAEKLKLEHDLPIYEAQVSRQRAIIAGRDRSEVIDATDLAEAAE